MLRIVLPFLMVLSLGWSAAGFTGDTGQSGAAEPPRPGELVLPPSMQQDQGNKSDTAGEKKNCMTVCARWGEECILVDKGAGGMERKCRRTCKQFTEECF